MELATLLDRLGYSDSPHFLRRGSDAFASAPDFGHVFRKASSGPCGLQGVYTLRQSPESLTDPLVPVVYVCQAETDDAANTIRRLVWNQDVVPFVLVHSPRGLRLYSGFRYNRRKEGVEAGVLRTLTRFNAVSEIVESFRADAIDSGRLWRDWGRYVTPEKRVDWNLLDNLKKLDLWLRSRGGLAKDVSHALIGKYVYLHYLRHRDILSDRKLRKRGLDAATVFGRTATRAGLLAVTRELDAWLNGTVFPLRLRGKGAPTDEHVQRVAATFAGDEIVGDKDWQLHLDFQAYDFSYIPIETLSVVYEQFLHSPEKDGKTTKGKAAGAYYTPIPVVNLMLAELEGSHPLQRGMKILDPACGSGAFLVQCYRRLIEKTQQPAKERPSPAELRRLLEGHIFGVDNDPDACSVTELSLILTLLDYVDRPDLEVKGKKRPLPALRDKNIFHSNFFALSKRAERRLAKTKFDWIVGNPPWKGLDPNPRRLIPQDEPVWKWMSSPENAKTRPCGDNEVAQAFAWRVVDVLEAHGAAALLLPAMTLFEEPSKKFRAAFSQAVQLETVANFSNLAEVLFAGRSRVPAAAFVYRLRAAASSPPASEHIAVYSPLVANQEATRSDQSDVRSETWNLVVNAGEIRDLPLAAVAGGAALPWKLATWGSAADERLLKKLEKRFVSLGQLDDEGVLIVAEGPALREKPVAEGPHQTRYIKDVVGKLVLDVKPLARLRRLFTFPQEALQENRKYHLDLRGSQRGLEVCRAPHVIVSAARNFAVFSDEYLIPPRRQIGIVSPTADADFLKALSLYLSSDFAYYHQFFTATELGVKRDRATISALFRMPVPFAEEARSTLLPWIDFYSRLAGTTPINVRYERNTRDASGQRSFAFAEGDKVLPALLNELNGMVYDALGLDARERALVHDLVHVRLELNDGKLGQPAIRLPKVEELRGYARRLKGELDDFLGDASPKRHQVGVVFDDRSGMVQIDLIADRQAARELVVAQADTPTAKQLQRTRQRLRLQHAQWVYFDRNLRLFEGTKTFLFKPMQRFHWTESQALFDASEIIVETLQLGESSP